MNQLCWSMCHCSHLAYRTEQESGCLPHCHWWYRETYYRQSNPVHHTGSSWLSVPAKSQVLCMPPICYSRRKLKPFCLWMCLTLSIASPLYTTSVGYCPSLATALISCYRGPTKRFVDGDVLYSHEGTGHPPCILSHSNHDNVNQDWYVDDASVSAKVYVGDGVSLGPKYGYAAKTWLITK